MSFPADRLMPPCAVWMELLPFNSTLPVPGVMRLLRKLYPAAAATDQPPLSRICAPLFREMFPPACIVNCPLPMPVLALKSQTVLSFTVMSPVACSLMLEKFLFENTVFTFKFNVPGLLL